MFKTLFATVAIAFLCAGSLVQGPLAPGLKLPLAASEDPTTFDLSTIVPTAPPGTRVPLSPDQLQAADASVIAALKPVAKDHYFTYLQHLAEGADVQRLTRDIENYYAAVGFNVAATELNQFDENESIAFTYNFGDVDHDGVDDIAMDIFCVNAEGCRPTPGCPPIPNPFRPDFLECIQKPPEIRIEREEWCTTPHRLHLISGVNGTEIWRRDLSQRPTIFDTERPNPEDLEDKVIKRCFYEMVVGKIPSPDGGDTVIIYRYQPILLPHIPGFRDGPGALVWDHTVYAIDRFTGGVLWTTPAYRGFCVGAGVATFTFVHCTNALVNPILQVPPTAGVDVVPAGTLPTLFLQGVGFNFTGLITPPIPTETWWRQWINDYQPSEWGARINLVDGKEFWHEETFTPYQKDTTSSVVPRALPEFMPTVLPTILPPPIGPNQGDVLMSSIYFWNYVPCCFDLNGDKVPDMAFTTLEWNNKPQDNRDGPYLMRSRLVTFNGLDGKQMWETVIDNAMPQYMFEEFSAGLGVFPYLELAGDLNGDAISDVLVHRLYQQYDFQNIVEAFDGASGKLMWTYKSARDVAPILLGDTNRDGSNDVLFVDWFDWQHPGITTYDFNNVTAKPLVLVNGRDGVPLWRAQTFSAPTDLAFIVISFRTNGVPDLNGDGIGEFPADDPIVLPDLTVVHQWRMLNGATGEPLRRITTVGQFSIPAYAGNLTGNGYDDLMILTGDIADLWVTLYDGETAQGFWSRRVMTPKLSEFTLAAPLQRYDTIRSKWRENDTLLNFHFSVVSCGGLVCNRATNPQVAHYAGPNGTSAWAYPRFWDPNITFRVWGPTPASLAFANLAAQYAERSGYAAATVENGSYVVPGLVTFGATALVCFGLGRRRWSK